MDSEAISEKKSTGSITRTPVQLPTSSSAEKLSVSEERKSVSKLDSMIQSRKRASEKLGLRKSRRTSSNDDEKQIKPQEIAGQVVELRKEEVTEVSISVVDNKTVTEIEKKEVQTVSESSAINAGSQNTKPETFRQDMVQPTEPSCEGKVEGGERVVRTEIEEDSLKEESHPADEKHNVEKDNFPNIQDDNTPRDGVNAEDNIFGSVLTVQSETSTDVQGARVEVGENRNSENIQEKSVISLEDSTDVVEGGQSWSQDLTDIDVSIGGQRETSEQMEEENISSNKDQVQEDHVDSVEPDTEKTRGVDAKESSNNNAETDIQKDNFVNQEIVMEKDTAEVKESKNTEEEKLDVPEEAADETTLQTEPVTDSLSESKSEGSTVEKVQMQISSESGTTTSEEVDEYNKTLTEDDFKKMLEANKEEETKPQEKENESDQIKLSPEHAGASSLASSGYVKNMIEEAMVESLKESDSHSDRSSDKSSDMVRIESGMNSGHTSGDEIDTTTSSDIEIISTPTPNGEYRLMERPFDLSPLRHALSKTVRRGGSPTGHKRSDSGSSAQSNWSKNGDDLLSPEGNSKKHHDLETSHTHGKYACLTSFI